MKEDSTGVSVIIASYNCASFIEECLGSIFDQDYLGIIEVIVCDDCSTDGTLSILERIEKTGRIILIKNETNLGPALTRNKCIERASQDYIAIQDADDYSHSHRISALMNCLKDNPSIDFVSSGIQCFFEDGSTKNIIPSKDFPDKRDFLFTAPFPHAATLFRKKVLINVGGYDNFIRAEDYYLFMKLYAAGYKGMNIKDVLYYYRCFKASNERDRYEYRINEAKVRYKGFKIMGLALIGLPYVLKPLILGLFPKRVLLYLRGIMHHH